MSRVVARTVDRLSVVSRQSNNRRFIRAHLVDLSAFHETRTSKRSNGNSEGSGTHTNLRRAQNISTPAIGADGTIYISCSNYKFYALNPDGTQKWEYTTEGIIDSSPAIGVDGTIYVGSYDNKLYAFIDDNGGLADTQWPKYQQNNSNTGRVE